MDVACSEMDGGAVYGGGAQSAADLGPAFEDGMRDS